MLYCPNPACQTLNPEGNHTCQQCHTPLPYRYLWAAGIGDPPPAESDRLLADRYLSKGHGIFLDTLPGYPPGGGIEEVPDILLAYLRLSPYRLHLPLAYDLILQETPAGESAILLLEEAALWQPQRVLHPSSPGEKLGSVALLPAIPALWEKVSGRRQLSWLWQIAALWDPFQAENVGSTLLTPDLMRAEGSLLRILELRPDNPEHPSSLAHLGHLWQSWQETAHPEVVPFLETLCLALQEGSIASAEALLEELDQQLAIANRHQPRYVHIATQTDQGPTRSRNEDACYPSSGTLQSEQFEGDLATPSLVIVCDGIGGHQGGDVASNLAISSIQQQLQDLPIANLSPEALVRSLEESISLANDRISQRNDDEARQERQRMGTTVVMGLLKNYELYVAHVGDSRAYYITPWGCHQITLDDDVASRQMRLGYNFYRQALQHPNAGSLVQALGMNRSNLLYPTVQRVLIDEDSLFLFCSDGLSDGDRVEEHWDAELLPILQGKMDLAYLSHRLVELANTLNGHDNVTIGLVHCQVPAATGDRTTLMNLMESVIQHPMADIPTAPPVLTTELSLPPAPTQLVSEVPSLEPLPARRQTLPVLLSLLFTAILGGVLVYLLLPWLRSSGLWLSGPTPPPSSPTPTPTALPPSLALVPGDVLQIGRVAAGSPAPLTLSSQPQLNSPNPKIIPAGSLVQVMEKPTIEEGTPWLKLRVCTLSQVAEAPLVPEPPGVATSASSIPPVQVGDEGWVEAAQIQPLALPLAPEDPSRATCQTPISPPPTAPATPIPSSTPLG